MASVLVNGQDCRRTRIRRTAPFECDVTGAIKAGQVNELCVVVKDNYYAFSEKKLGKNIRWNFNIPSTWMDGRSNVVEFFDFPIGCAYGCVQPAGILQSPPALSPPAQPTPPMSLPSHPSSRNSLPWR